MRWRDQTRDVLALDQALKQFADLAADRIYRRHVGAEAVRDTRHVDAAAAGIALGRRAAQFARRLDTADIDENIDRRIYGESNDVRHVTAPFEGLI